ncbi:MAG: chemotaxis protein [Clostridiales bacterium]|nr:chemotaxis protein [Clostridiales bacterium]
MEAVKKKEEILLESGTNELELIEFSIGSRSFGINVSKVEEILRFSNDITPMPHSNEFVEGVFKPRGTIITIINLARYLGLQESDNPENDILIVTGFNKLNTAFHVHKVKDIHRISWREIEKPDITIYGGQSGVATGIARYDDRLITILDFEKILADISPQSTIKTEEIDMLGERPVSHKPILIAEDSSLLEELICKSLEKARYTNIIRTANGEEAWEKLNELKSRGGPIKDSVSMVITDIEMPKMDGHHLLKRIREDKDLSILPVIVFSSLINKQMRQKGEQLGATAQIAKPEIGKLVSIIDQYIL